MDGIYRMGKYQIFYFLFPSIRYFFTPDDESEIFFKVVINILYLLLIGKIN